MVQATNEAVIWSRLMQPDQADMPVEVARFFLQLSFNPQDLACMHDLAVRNQDGALTTEEHEELRSYRHVGLQLDVLRAKASLFLKRSQER